MITVIPNATEQNLRIGADDTGDFIRAATQMSAQREANQAMLVKQARDRVMELQDNQLAGGLVSPQTKQVTHTFNPDELAKSRDLESTWRTSAATDVVNGEQTFRSAPHGPNVMRDAGMNDVQVIRPWLQEFSKSTDPADVSLYQKLNLQPGYTDAQAMDAITRNGGEVGDAVRRTGWSPTPVMRLGYAVPGSMLTNIFEKPYGR